MRTPYDEGRDPTDLEDAVLALLEEAELPSAINDRILELVGAGERLKSVEQDATLIRSAEVSLEECPPGLLLYMGKYLGFKTEYGAIGGRDVGGGKVEYFWSGGPDAYIIESGERLCLDADTKVIPIRIAY